MSSNTPVSGQGVGAREALQLSPEGAAPPYSANKRSSKYVALAVLFILGISGTAVTAYYFSRLNLAGRVGGLSASLLVTATAGAIAVRGCYVPARGAAALPANMIRGPGQQGIAYFGTSQAPLEAHRPAAETYDDPTGDRLSQLAASFSGHRRNVVLTNASRVDESIARELLQGLRQGSPGSELNVGTLQAGEDAAKTGNAIRAFITVAHDLHLGCLNPDCSRQSPRDIFYYTDDPAQFPDPSDQPRHLRFYTPMAGVPPVMLPTSHLCHWKYPDGEEDI